MDVPSILCSINKPSNTPAIRETHAEPLDQVFDHVDDRVLLAAAQPAHPHAVHPPLGALQPHARLPHLSAVSRIPPHHSPGRLRYTTFCYKQLFN